MSPEIGWYPHPPTADLATRAKDTLQDALRAEGMDVDARVQLTRVSRSGDAHDDACDVRLVDNAKDAGIRRRLAERLRAAGFPAVAAPTQNRSNVALKWSGTRPQDADLVEEIALGELARLEDLRTGRVWRDHIAGHVYVTFAYETELLGVELTYSSSGVMRQQTLSDDEADARRYRARLVDALRAEGFNVREAGELRTSGGTVGE